MPKNAYDKAMKQLPFSDDLEARTLQKLEAFSAKAAKEKQTMKTKESFSFSKKGFTPRKFLFSGGMLALATSLLLLTLPILQTTPPVSSPLININNDMQETADHQPVISLPQVSSVMETYDTAMEAEAAIHMPALYAASAPIMNTEEYRFFAENRFLSTLTSPMSTFAADVDTASYAKLRATLLAGNPVPEDSVRIEEMLNYFSYSYAAPQNGEPFGITTEIADCPWNPNSKLLLIGLQAEEIQKDHLPGQNLVFLIDVSGSMDEPNKLPLVKRAFRLLLDELQPTDTVSIVTYASGDRIVLDGVRASDKITIMAALDEMTAGGGTAGAKGIQTAYELASKHFIQGGNNRILLATDGDLNVGISDEGSLTRLIEEKRETGVFLSVLGFGMGNYKDNKLEALADHGNGNYAYIDTIFEARKALVEEMGGTFFTVAKDVKLQVEFNPSKLKGYRLIGYENRTMAAEDFANDKKDGGEVGSGHQVTVLYELVPLDSPMDIPAVESKYQSSIQNQSEEWFTLHLRCKAPDGEESKLFSYPIGEEAYSRTMSDNLRFASAIAQTGMLLRNSEYKADASYVQALDLLRNTTFLKGDPYKEEFQYLVSLLARQQELPLP